MQHMLKYNITEVISTVLFVPNTGVVLSTI